ncbi:hypothetical protein BGX33_006402 [Mortierella sp. NVP41]|nr:hypothetical protein BGX33_006402 [Mortierella sp. NVP41]
MYADSLGYRNEYRWHLYVFRPIGTIAGVREQVEPESTIETGPKDEEQEKVIPMDVMLSEIQRLVAHEFGGPNKATPYPTVLKPLYQRLQDYNVLLKSARRKLDQQQCPPVSGHLSPMTGGLSAGSDISSNKLNLAVIATTASADAEAHLTASPISTPISARLFMKNNNLLEVSTVTVASLSNSAFVLDNTQGLMPQLQERIVDLEQQLAQSRRAHHTLLQDHILNLKKTSSHFLIGSRSASKLPNSDAKAIYGILTAVNFDSSSSLPVVSRSSITNNKSKKKKKDSQTSSSLRKDNSSTQGTNSDNGKDIFQETIQAAQELHARHIRQLKGITTTSTSSSPSSATFSDNPSTSALLTSDSEPSLVAMSSQQLMSEATTRLLRAETEFGLLKLVMAQNQEEILGLEEDVFRAQRELKNHRKVFESLLELHHLGFEAQIREDQLQIRTLEGQIKKAEADKDEAEKLVKKLELDLEEKERNLGEKRDSYLRQEQDLRDGPVRDLEAEIEQLKFELAAQEAKIREMEQQTTRSDGDNQMAEYLEQQHKKATTALKASLAKAQRTNLRLNREVSALARKMVAVETLNDKYAEQTTQDRAQLADLQQQAEDLQTQLDKATSNTSASTTTGQQNDTKATIAALEIQIEELSSSLRLKENELEQALEETEQLALKLEQDLALQQEAQKAEMTRFSEEKKIQAQRERACQSTSVTLFQNMVIKLHNELSDTQEKLRDTTLCWGHTKEQLQKCEQSYR